MNNSKEELIELSEFTSPLKDKTKRRNKVDFSPSHSITSVSTFTDEANIVNIFSATPRSLSGKGKYPSSHSEKHTISEISDGILIKHEPSYSRNDGDKLNYKQKVSERLKKIRERVGTSQEMSKSSGRTSVEKIKCESQNVDAEVELVRKRLNLEEGSCKQDRDRFFKFEKETKRQLDDEASEAEEHMNEDNIVYVLPDLLHFNLQISEKNCFFIPNRLSIDVSKKTGNAETRNQEADTNLLNIPNKDKHLLEQRLLGIDDIRWFDCKGELYYLQEPRTNETFHPKELEPDPTIVEYKPPFLGAECDEVVVIKDRILNVYFSELKFNYHPLFSIEHLFVETLKEMYEGYNNDKVDVLKKQLEDLRAKRVSAIELRNQSGDASNIIITNIDFEIKKMRIKYYEEAERQRNCLRCALETWKQIKKIRDSQKYSNTGIYLKIQKERCDLDTEKQIYEEHFKTDLAEIMREERNELNNDGIAEVESQLGEDINEDKLKTKLSRRFKKCFKQPGEPIIRLVVINTHPISETVPYNKETTRRNVVASTKIYLRIVCNDIEACKTNPVNLNDIFSIEFNEMFSLQLTDIPKFLTVEIIEQQKGIQKKKICEFNISIPITTNTSKELLLKHFEKNEIIHYKHEGLGSGTDLKTVAEKVNINISKKDNRELKTSGYLGYELQWDTVYEGLKQSGLDEKFKMLNDAVDKQFKINRAILKEFIEKGGEQFKDVFNCEDFIEKDSDILLLNEYQKGLKFCNVTEIDNNLRYRILQLRDQKEVEFDGMLVPNRIKEIPFNILDDFKRRKAAEGGGNSFEDVVEDEFEMQRSYGKKYLKQVQVKIFQICKNTENNLTYESVVDEKYFINLHVLIRTIIKNIINWFRWQPKVSKPLPMFGKKCLADKEDLQLSDNIYLNINIVSAKNIPNRLKNTCNKNDDLDNEVMPFVRVIYKNITERTTTGKGANPFWNEMLTIPLESSHTDYLNPNSLNGSIVIDLFDECDTESKIVGKRASNWLGTLQISLSAVCCDENLQGLFKLKLPHLLLGYQTEEQKLRTKSPKMGNIPSLQTYLELDISIRPNIPKITPNMEELPCGEVPFIQQHILNWNSAFNNSIPSRKFSALVMNTNARTTCVTRFLRPLEPPPLNFEEFDVTVEQCLRYVSLIPFTDCNHFYSNIWLSTEQLLHLMIGSVTDHAIALTCYLMALKLDVWLLLGYGIPHGTTAYVLLREYIGETQVPNFYILDVFYNEKYSLSDVLYPLQKIYCLINDENVWANIQKNDNINITRFDLTRKSDWLPLFSKQITAPTVAINNSINYRTRSDMDDLEMQVERLLKKQITKLRQLDRTIWNKNLSSIFKNVLRSFEMNCMYNKNHHETLVEMNTLTSSYKVTGFVFNMGFKNVLSVAKKMKDIVTTLQEESDMEFAMAVYLHVYPSNVISAWIFLANIKLNE